MRRTTSFAFAPWQLGIIGGLGCAALLAGGYVAILRPIEQEQHRLHQLRTEHATLETRATAAERSQSMLQEKLAGLESEVASNPVQLEPVSHLNSRLATLVDLATKSQMMIDQTQSGERRPGQWFDTVNIRLTGRGSFSECVRFLHRLHTMLPDVEAVGFELTGNPSTPTAAPSFRFDLAWYAAPTVASAE
ncbi:MAG: hypothetical protein HKO59_00470 [Phycisphaerales bacterium]|nr:hypothetical protein [Phycisphaerae bacterium]NNF44184.1 hypothetical protein [Phycisphaerales bacterium]NNM24454.1 hypothetical protein [Phycisphaerales bacterium]